MSANIRAGSTVFGVGGDPNVVDTSSGDAVAAEIAAGRRAWVDGVEVVGSALPRMRFIDNGDGTVTDATNGLVWLRDASCAQIPGTDATGRGNYSVAIFGVADLASGMCGLADGSQAGGRTGAFEGFAWSETVDWIHLQNLEIPYGPRIELSPLEVPSLGTWGMVALALCCALAGVRAVGARDR